MMRFMGLVRAVRNSEAAATAEDDLLIELEKHTEHLARAGRLLATDGPFVETKELVR